MIDFVLGLGSVEELSPSSFEWLKLITVHAEKTTYCFDKGKHFKDQGD